MKRWRPEEEGERNSADRGERAVTLELDGSTNFFFLPYHCNALTLRPCRMHGECSGRCKRERGSGGAPEGMRISFGTLIWK